jgi:alkylhydroperoxidase family enzyme
VDETPRIGYDDLPRVLRERLRPRVERLGYLGEFFQVAAHQPEALAGFIDYTEALKDAVDWRLVEAIALTIASMTANDYERVQHERFALRLGMSIDEVRALTAGDAARFAPTERAAVRLAHDVVLAGGRGCPDAYRELVTLAGPAVAVGCLMTAVRYLAHATMANTWEVRAPVASPVDALVEGTAHA